MEQPSQPHPEAARIALRAFNANIAMPKVLRRAGVGRATWWRIRNGGNFEIGTIVKLDKALDEMIAERDGAPHRATEEAPDGQTNQA